MNEVIQTTTYQAEVTQYTKKDAIYALLFFAVLMLLSIVPILPRGQIPNLVFTIMVLVALFALVIKIRQGLHSIGLHLMDWKKTFAAGLFIVVVLLMLNNGLLPGLLGGWQIPFNRNKIKFNYDC